MRKFAKAFREAPTSVQIGVVVFTGSLIGIGIYKLNSWYKANKLLQAQQAGANLVVPGNMNVNPNTGAVTPKKASEIAVFDIAGRRLPKGGVNLATIAGDIHEEAKLYPFWYTPANAFAAIRQTPVKKTRELQNLYTSLYGDNLLDDLRKVLSTNQFLEVKFYFK